MPHLSRSGNASRRRTKGIAISGVSPSALEAWRQVPGIPGYDVSSLGRVRGPISLLKPALLNGYQVIKVRGGSRYVHGLVALAFIGPRPHGHHINHIDLDRANNAPANLEYVLAAENNLHSRCLRPWNSQDRCDTCGATALLHRADRLAGCDQFTHAKETP